MATKNIVPNSNGEGEIGTSSKYWSKSHINTITVGTSVVPDAQDGAALGTTSLQFSDLFLADSSVIGFGDDNDTTLTHTDGSGLTLNSTNKLMFNDASQFIQGSSATVLSLGATDEIDLTATAIDVNGTIDVSGDATFASNARIGSQAFPAFNSNRDVLVIGQKGNLSAIDSSGDIYLNNNIFVNSSGEDRAIAAGGTAQLRLSDSEILIYTGDSPGAGAAATLTPRLTISSTVSTFGNNIQIPNDGTIGSAGTAGAITIASDGDIGIGDTTPEEALEIKRSSSPAIQLNQADTYKGIIRLAGNDLEIRGSANNMEFYNGGNNDGDSATLALTIDSSQDATFAGDIKIPDAGTIGCASDTDLLTLSSGQVILDGNTGQGVLQLATKKPAGSLNIGQSIGEINFRHNHAATAATVTSARIIGAAGENTVSSQDNHGGQLEFYTAADGNNETAPVIRTTIKSDGTLVQNGNMRLGTGTTGAEAVADDFIIEPGISAVGMSIISTTSGQGQISFGDTDDADIGAILYVHGSDDEMIFRAGTTNTMSIKSGNVLISSTTGKLHVGHDGSALAGDGADRDGVSLSGDGTFTVHKDGNPPVSIGRAQDGKLVKFFGATTEQGDITLSGSTVSFNGFQGCHESSGISNNIDIGTVVSTIDELDTNLDGSERENHPKIKVSDESGDKRVYGVLVRYDEDSSKPILASTGIGPIKVTGACVGGDLLESNGDGTAKVQSDDIIKSKTIGKVTIGNSSTSVKIVSCVLYCG